MAENNIIEEVIELSTNETDEVGNVKISTEVVGAIAGVAATEIAGVAGMSGSFAGGIAEIFGAKKSPSKGVKVDIKEQTANLDLYIIVDYGVRIPELAWEIQERVKNDVETMTGLIVENVNIHVDGVKFPKEVIDSSANIDEDDEEIIIEEAEIEELPEENSEDL